MQSAYVFTGWTYDIFGRTQSITQSVTGISRALSFDYSTGDEPIGLHYPSGRHVGLSTTSGRPNEISVDGSPVITNITYSPAGKLSGFSVFGSNYGYSFNQDGLLTQTPVESSIQYDAQSRITHITSSLASGSSGAVTYNYDALNRLTSVDRATANQYFYDSSGNRASMITVMGTQIYDIALGSNRLLSRNSPTGSNSYSYDAAGNTLSNGAHTFSYQSRNSIASVDGGVTATYKYDGFNRRVLKHSMGSERSFFYDQENRLIGEYDQLSSSYVEYVYLQNIPILALTPQGAYVLLSDHLGAPRAAFDASGSRVWHWAATEFGADAPTGSLGSIPMNLRQPGHYFDAETGLFYNWNRHYDPAVGRYLQSDPIGLSGGLNPYAYANGNPVSFFDPNGLLPFLGEQIWMILALQLEQLLGTQPPAIPQTSMTLALTIPSATPELPPGFFPPLKLPPESSIVEMCSLDEGTDDNCESLYQSILNTCASLKGRKKFKCFAAAAVAREQCYQERNYKGN